MESPAEKTYVFVQDHASHHHEGYFAECVEDGDQDSDKHDTPAGETTCSGQRKVGISSTDNQRQDGRETESRVEPELVLNACSELTDCKGFDLSPETESVWALLRNTLVFENDGTESFLVTLLLCLAGLVFLR